MSYFYSNGIQNVLDKLNIFVFLSSYYPSFQQCVKSKFVFSFLHRKKDYSDTMLIIFQKFFIDKAYELGVPQSDIEKHLENTNDFLGWVRVYMDNSKELHNEMIYRFRNNKELLENHKMFINSLENLILNYNLDNYTTCIMYFDNIWDELDNN